MRLARDSGTHAMHKESKFLTGRYLNFKFMRGFIPIILIFAILTSFHSSYPLYALDKAALEKELKDIEEQIKVYEKELVSTQKEKKTLESTLKRLRGEQAKLRLEIEKTKLEIGEISLTIDDTRKSLDDTVREITDIKNDLSHIIRTLERRDTTFIVALFSGENGFENFFNEVKDLERLSAGVVDISKKLQGKKNELSDLTFKLEGELDDTKNLLSTQSLRQDAVVSKTREQNTLLDVTKGREAAFSEALAEKKKRAKEIRNAVYELLGVTDQITFGQAVEIASWASGQTGVRTAFLLAVLKQESNLGKNVGTCNRIGDPPEKSWRNIMKPDRDQEPFLKITAELGVDPDITPVSCPMRDSKGNRIGWGGAMGPAQFIPSTWVKYGLQVEERLGKKANPWDIRDAFLAAALLLKANGASGGGEDAEWKAAMRYFSGGTNPRFRFYGDRVIELARGFEEDIEAIR